MLIGLLAPWRATPLASIHLCAIPPCCEPDGPLCPADAPQATVATSDGSSLRLRVPDDDAVMEDYIGQAHQVALAADDYDAAMLAHCEQAITQDPAYWAQLWPSAVALARLLQVGAASDEDLVVVRVRPVRDTVEADAAVMRPAEPGAQRQAPASV